MSPEEAFAQWRADLSSRSVNHWSQLTEALGRLALHNSHGIHGPVVMARLNDLDGIVSDFRAALNSGHETDEPTLGGEQQVQHQLTETLPWSHLKPETAFLNDGDSDHLRAINGHLLEQVIERYMRSPWLANDALEWMMADAAAYQRVVSFGESIKRNVKGLKDAVQERQAHPKARRTVLRAIGVCGELSAFVAGPIVLAALAPDFAPGRLVLWIAPAALACVVIYTNVALLRASRRNSSKKLISKSLAKLSAMFTAYRALEGRIVSIGRVRHELKKAAPQGNNWSPQIFALLDYAEARGAQTWKL